MPAIVALARLAHIGLATRSQRDNRPARAYVICRVVGFPRRTQGAEPRSRRERRLKLALQPSERHAKRAAGEQGLGRLGEHTPEQAASPD